MLSFKKTKKAPFSQLSLEKQFEQRTQEIYKVFSQKLLNAHGAHHTRVHYNIHWQFTPVDKKASPKEDLVLS